MIAIIIFAFIVKKFTEGFTNREASIVEVWSFYGKVGKSVITFIAIVIIITTLFPHHKETPTSGNNSSSDSSVKKEEVIKTTKQDIIDAFDIDYKASSKKYLNKRIEFISDIDNTSGDKDNLSNFNANENNFSSYLIGKTKTGQQVDLVMTTESHQDVEFQKEYTWTGELSMVSQYEWHPSIFDFIDVNVK